MKLEEKKVQKETQVQFATEDGLETGIKTNNP